jgi:hypothetical protein
MHKWNLVLNYFLLDMNKKYLPVGEYTLLPLLPHGVARNAHVQIFEIAVIVSDVHDVGILDVFGVGFASGIGAFHIVDMRDSRVVFGVFVDHEVESLLVLFNVGV